MKSSGSGAGAQAAVSRSRSGGSSGGGAGALAALRASSSGSSASGGGGGDATPTASLADEERGSLEPYLPAVVQVFTSSVANDWSMPWSRDLPQKSTGSGWILDVARRLIVTNAHVVEFASTLQVRREGEAEKFEAHVVVVAHQVDLALLTVKKAAFWQDAAQLDLGPSPRIQQEVHVLGYPEGGDGISITGGVVSRVDFGSYSQSKKSNLSVQVDAAINSGNSGGPALSKGRCVGVAFQSLEEGDNIGYIVPSAIVRRLVEDYDAAPAGAPVQLRGFAEFALHIQAAENAALRMSVGLPEGVSGVIVRSVPKMSK